jgi:hypothetical protein
LGLEIGHDPNALFPIIHEFIGIEEKQNECAHNQYGEGYSDNRDGVQKPVLKNISDSTLKR